MFDSSTWYRARQRKDTEFNSCVYQPLGWDVPCRFVAMRIPKDVASGSTQPVQCALFEDDRYKYRIFCTSLSGCAHEIISQYDKRADVENLVGEAKREGLDAIPSGKFKNNYAFFQMVMLVYNIWRYMKLMAAFSMLNKESGLGSKKARQGPKAIASNTIRIARLKLLFIAAKVVKDQNRDKIKYSIHDARTPIIMGFLKILDEARSTTRPWDNNEGWSQRFALAK